MAIETIEVRKCDFCGSIIDGHYYVYRFRIWDRARETKSERDICTRCAEKMSPVLSFLDVAVGIKMFVQVESAIHGGKDGG